MDARVATAPVSVVLPSVLRSRSGGRGTVSAWGATVREVIESLEAQYPGLRFNLCHETGELRPHVNIFVNSENIRYLQGLDTPISCGVTVRVIQSVSGG
jgi:sulfur-carrier protein